MRQSRRRTTCRYKRYFWSVCVHVFFPLSRVANSDAPFSPPLHNPQANHSARTANEIYGNTGHGIGKANHSQIVGCLHFTRVYQRLLGVHDGSFDRRREAERQRREQLGKFVVGIRNWLCLVLKSVPSHLNGRTHREWD